MSKTSEEVQWVASVGFQIEPENPAIVVLGERFLVDTVEQVRYAHDNFVKLRNLKGESLNENPLVDRYHGLLSYSNEESFTDEQKREVQQTLSDLSEDFVDMGVDYIFDRGRDNFYWTLVDIADHFDKELEEMSSVEETSEEVQWVASVGFQIEPENPAIVALGERFLVNTVDKVRYIHDMFVTIREHRGEPLEANILDPYHELLSNPNGENFTDEQREDAAQILSDLSDDFSDMALFDMQVEHRKVHPVLLEIADYFDEKVERVTDEEDEEE